MRLLKLLERVVCRCDELSPVFACVVKSNPSVSVLPAIDSTTNASVTATIGATTIACTLIVNTLQNDMLACSQVLIPLIMCRLCLYFIIRACAG